MIFVDLDMYEFVKDLQIHLWGVVSSDLVSRMIQLQCSRSGWHQPFQKLFVDGFATLTINILFFFAEDPNLKKIAVQHTWNHSCICIHIWAYLLECICQFYKYIYIYTYMHICIHTCAHICTYIFMLYIYIYTYVHIHIYRVCMIANICFTIPTLLRSLPLAMRRGWQTCLSYENSLNI